MSAGVIRFIGGFTADVTIIEQHIDEMTITQHPVERGAAITDHAFKNPAQLTIKAGWTPETDAPTDIYGQLLAAMVSAQPIEVQTGKRLYENMLIRRLSQDTTIETENVLMATIVLQEIILVDTMTTTMPAAANRQNPQATSGVGSGGAKTLSATTLTVA